MSACSVTLFSRLCARLFAQLPPVNPTYLSDFLKLPCKYWTAVAAPHCSLHGKTDIPAPKGFSPSLFSRGGKCQSPSRYQVVMLNGLIKKAVLVLCKAKWYVFVVYCNYWFSAQITFKANQRLCLQGISYLGYLFSDTDPCPQFLWNWHASLVW